ncbi:hypothetical protein KPL78_26890 [Roseomonas sp. HJA6]|uniref:Solute-binding protein family 5 domain-containing protein n=1 Tax=Roseomonas alba TaxID=2846776 RepID=A0ABS7AIH4_9PROT|nr:hypothetical protein [Neoroseomonas alba]MBW6401507.1 hypothetical protein [Neoroseomonas alba]
MVPPDHPWFGNPSFRIRHDPKEAKRLLAEAGFGPAKPVEAKIIISASGSGQMQPTMMNKAIQDILRPLASISASTWWTGRRWCSRG